MPPSTNHTITLCIQSIAKFDAITVDGGTSCATDPHYEPQIEQKMTKSVKNKWLYLDYIREY